MVTAIDCADCNGILKHSVLFFEITMNFSSSNLQRDIEVLGN